MKTKTESKYVRSLKQRRETRITLNAFNRVAEAIAPFKKQTAKKALTAVWQLIA